VLKVILPFVELFEKEMQKESKLIPDLIVDQKVHKNAMFCLVEKSYANILRTKGSF
jgi:hypothetical protein